MATLKRLLVNPHRPKRKKPVARKKTPATTKGARKRNPGTLAVLGALNPNRGHMKKRKNSSKPRRRKNGTVVTFKPKAKAKSKAPRRRNPNVVSRSVDVLKTGVMALGGLVITRQIPQMLLGAKNTGMLGYASNLGVALGAAALVSRFNRNAGAAIGIGGALYLANRIISEQFSPIGRVLSLSGVGDATANLSGIRQGYFPVPVVKDRAGNPIIPEAIRSNARDEARAVVASLPPSPPASKVAGYRYSR